MFRSNNSHGNLNQCVRSQILIRALKERKKREAHRHASKHIVVIQAFCRGRCSSFHTFTSFRCDYDNKISDILKLQQILGEKGISNFCPPGNILMELFRQFMFIYREPLDRQRLEIMCQFLIQDLKKPEHTSAFAEKILSNQVQWKYLLKILIFVCIESQVFQDTTFTNNGHLFDTRIHLVAFLTGHTDPQKISFPNCLTNDPFYPLYSFTMEQLTLKKNSFFEIVRKQFLVHRKNLTATSTAGLFILIMRVLNYVQDTISIVLAEFLSQILSTPTIVLVLNKEIMNTLFLSSSLYQRVLQSFYILKPILPSTPGDISNTSLWLLGNLLDLSSRVSKKSRDIVVLESTIFANLLNDIPQETYGTASLWKRVNEVHQIPVPFPQELVQQLQILVHENEIRKTCKEILKLPSNLQRPLCWEKPVPMDPNASTEEEKYGFGSLGKNESRWNQLWPLPKKWSVRFFRKKLQEKEGSVGLVDTSSTARAMALGKWSAAANNQANTASSLLETTNQPASCVSEYKKSFEMLSRLYSLFLMRWPVSRNPNSIGILNTLAFTKLKAFENSSRDLSIIEILWTYVQEQNDVAKLAKKVELDKATGIGTSAILALFCLVYNHILLILDDGEMYVDQYPLPLFEVERVVSVLKWMIYKMYWTQGVVTATDNTYSFFLVKVMTQLLRQLYNRCSRRPFCNITSWLITDLDGESFVEQVVSGTPRATQLLVALPYALSFKDRIRLFRKLVDGQRNIYQPQDKPPLRVRIRRKHLLEDGLVYLNSLGKGLRQRIQIIFVNETGMEESGIDAGGLFKEYWTDLSIVAFDPRYGLFKETEDQLLYPNPCSKYNHQGQDLDLMEFLGRILGKALFEGLLAQPKFAYYFLSKLLNNHNQINDLPSLDRELYKNLMFLKNYEGNVDDLGLSFTVVENEYEEQKEVELMYGGSSVAVTNENRIRYIHAVANFHLNDQIREQSTAFISGLRDLIDLNWLKMFNEPELQVLISGTPGAIDLKDLQQNTQYTGGYYRHDKHVRRFWKVLEELSCDELQRFLRFATSCQRPPTLGFHTLNPLFCLQKVSIKKDSEKLPTASTCFNTLKLPTYSTKAVMKEKLLLSINAQAGFELT